MRAPASVKTSAITVSPSRRWGWSSLSTQDASRRDQRADGVAQQSLRHVARGLHAEHAHVHAVVHAEAERGRVDDLETPLQRVLVGDAVDAGGRGILLRI